MSKGKLFACLLWCRQNESYQQGRLLLINKKGRIFHAASVFLLTWESEVFVQFVEPFVKTVLSIADGLLVVVFRILAGLNEVDGIA